MAGRVGPFLHSSLEESFAPVRSTPFRLVARVFAVLLLAWTTADLCCGLCVHDGEPIAAAVPAGHQGERTVIGPPASAAADLPYAPDDCFCCSHFVQPQVPYQVVPIYALISAVETTAAPSPQFPASQLYHPPLAAA
jgi:hypothetical protein